MNSPIALNSADSGAGVKHGVARFVVSILAFTLLMLVFCSAYAAEVAGRLMFVHGSVNIERDGTSMTAKRGGNIFAGDKVVTGGSSSVQIRFTDGGTLAVRPNSEIEISQYAYNDTEEGSSQETSLIRGGLRSITGAIGHRNPASVSYKTPVATIGIRGTIIRLVHYDEGSPDLPAGARSGTYLMVEEGAAAATSSSTRLVRAGGALAIFKSDADPESYPADSPVFGSDKAVTNPGQNKDEKRVIESSGVTSQTTPSPETDTSILNNRNLSEDQRDDDQDEAELQCQSEGFSSCAEREEYLLAEKQCIDEGYLSCADKDSQPTEEQCVSEGFDSCQARDEYLAAEKECRLQGFTSCSARDFYQKLEDECKAEGFASCAEKDAFVAAEFACKQEGFTSCEAKEQALIKDRLCQGYGYNDCSVMLNPTGRALNPADSLIGQGVLFAGTSGTVLSFAGNSTTWVSSDESSSGGLQSLFVGADISDELRIQRLMPSFEDVDQHSLHFINPITDSKTYLGYWPKSEYVFLDPQTVSDLGEPLGPLVYSASDSLLTDLSDIQSSMDSGALGLSYDFLLAADTSKVAPVLDGMVLLDMSLHYDVQDQKLRGGAQFEGGQAILDLYNYDGVTISTFLEQGINFSGSYYSSSEVESSSSGNFFGGFSGDSSTVDGMFGVLYAEVPELSLSGEVGVALNGVSNYLPPLPGQRASYYGLLGLDSSLSAYPEIRSVECVSGECFADSAAYFETLLASGAQTFGLALENYLNQNLDNEHMLASGEMVYWGVWQEADYSVVDSDPSLSPISNTSIGVLPYIYTSAKPQLNDLSDLVALTGNDSVQFNMVAGGEIYDASGSFIAALDYMSSLTLNIGGASPSMDIYLELGSDGTLSTSGAALPDLTGFDQVALTGSGTFTGGLASGRFAGSDAEAIMLLIETSGVLGKGVSLLER